MPESHASSPAAAQQHPAGLYSEVFGSLTAADADTTAIIDIADGSRTDYDLLRSYIDSMGGWLAAKQLRPGAVVAVQLPNSLEFVVTVYALWRQGLQVLPLPLRASTEFAASALTAAEADLLITVSGLDGSSTHAAQQAGLDDSRIVHLDSSQGLPQILAERRSAKPATVSADATAVVLVDDDTVHEISHEHFVNQALAAQQSEAAELVPSGAAVYAAFPIARIVALQFLAVFALLQRSTLVVVPRVSERTITEHRAAYAIATAVIDKDDADALAGVSPRPLTELIGGADSYPRSDDAVLVTFAEN